MTCSPVQHAAADPQSAAATFYKTVEQLPVAAQALQRSTPAPESLSRASNSISRSNATVMSTQPSSLIMLSALLQLYFVDKNRLSDEQH